MLTVFRFVMLVCGIGLFSIITLSALILYGMRAEKRRAAREEARKAAEEESAAGVDTNGEDAPWS